MDIYSNKVLMQNFDKALKTCNKATLSKFIETQEKHVQSELKDHLQEYAAYLTDFLYGNNKYNKDVFEFLLKEDFLDQECITSILENAVLYNRDLVLNIFEQLYRSNNENLPIEQIKKKLQQENKALEAIIRAE